MCMLSRQPNVVSSMEKNLMDLRKVVHGRNLLRMISRRASLIALWTMDFGETFETMLFMHFDGANLQR
jgi:hypothetical protein